jgi:tetratricopeptide (TPR) repeat protein
MSSLPTPQAIGMVPDLKTAEDYLQRAWISMANKDFAQAEADFNESLRLNGQLADAFYGLGLILKVQGEPEKAIRSFQEALALIQMDIFNDMPQRGTILRNLCKSQISMLQGAAKPVAS